MSAMKEHGILFSAPMVRAILAGQKTQTRRLVKFPEGAEYDGHRPDGSEVRCSRPNESTGTHVIRAPHGPVGRHLYVKETYGLRLHTDETDWCRKSIKGWTGPGLRAIEYRADYGSNQEHCHWRPSIHMPRWASRITLEVTRVRVERVGDITMADVRAEGVQLPVAPAGNGQVSPLVQIPTPYAKRMDADWTEADYWRAAYAHLWDEINGAGSWSSNPWVWVYDFRRVT